MNQGDPPDSSGAAATPGRWRSWLHRLVKAEPQEVTSLLVSCVYFFSLLCSYYILRPVRDEMGIRAGVENLQWLFTGTFVVMLLAVPAFGALAARLPRARLLPAVYLFFIANILLFSLSFRLAPGNLWTTYALYVWTSVFNLFVVSVFWSFMADLFDKQQARRLFAFIAAGGSAGAVVGPLLTVWLTGIGVGPVGLLPISAAVLSVALVCIRFLSRHAGEVAEPAARQSESPTQELRAREEGRAVGGSVLGGLSLFLRSGYLAAIGALILLYTMVQTFMYFEQAHIVKAAFPDQSTARTQLFGTIDLVVNTLTIITQIFITGRLAARFGMARTLTMIPALTLVGFVFLGLAPVLSVLVTVQVLRRAGNYGILRPTREMLFTVVGREAKYKAKNFIDTVVYRGGDALTGWLFAGLLSVGLGLSAMAFVGVFIAAAFAVTAWLLGRYHDTLRGPVEASTVQDGASGKSTA